MNAIDQLREQGKMTRTDEEHGSIAAPEDITPDLEPNPYTEDGGES